MNPVFRFVPLFASLERWEALVGRFRGEYVPPGSSSLVSEVLILLIFMVLCISVGYLLWRHRVERRQQRPEAIFSGLCQAHGLDRKQRRTLRRLARAIREPDPARLFLQPWSFDLGTQPQRSRIDLEQLHLLRQRLFQP